MSTERPVYNCDEVCAATAEALYNDVKAWLTQAGDPAPDKQETLKDLARAISHSMLMDGYEIAKELDDDGWFNINSELVEILDKAYWNAKNAHRELIKKWIVENNITNQFNVGDVVTVNRKYKKPVQGEIIDMNKDEATYSVFCESLGHIRKEEGKMRAGTTAIIVPFEQVVACNVNEAVQ
jgi:hypothetical protein